MKAVLELPNVSNANAQADSSMGKSEYTSKRTMCMIILKSNDCRFAGSIKWLMNPGTMNRTRKEPEMTSMDEATRVEQ